MLDFIRHGEAGDNTVINGNAATIDAAIQTGVSQIDGALAQFPVAVFDDFVSALGGSL